jgi:arylformamidase
MSSSQSKTFATSAAQPVWLDMDQAQLDDAYSQIKYAPTMPQILLRYATNSDLARDRLGAPRRIAYGPTPEEKLDLYLAAAAHAPIAIYLHGGGWRTGAAEHYGFAAEMFVDAGAHYIAPDFVNVEATGGDLRPMVDQVRRAIAWVHRNAAGFGGDPDRIHLYGHSSGAHLGGVAMVTDWAGRFGLPADVIKTGLLCGGMYDLRPVRLSARSRYVRFTDEIEQELSPQRHLELFTSPVVLAYGSEETPEFQRQTRDFAAALRAVNRTVELIVGQHYNHFEIAETLGSPYGVLGRAALAQIGAR